MDPDLAPSSTCLPAKRPSQQNLCNTQPCQDQSVQQGTCSIRILCDTCIDESQDPKRIKLYILGIESLGKPIKQRKINLFTVIGNENEHL